MGFGHLHFAFAMHRQALAVVFKADELDDIVVIILKRQFFPAAFNPRHPRDDILRAKGLGCLAQLLQPIGNGLVEFVSGDVSDLEAHELFVKLVVDFDLHTQFAKRRQDILDVFVQTIFEDGVDIVRHELPKKRFDKAV